MSSVKFVPANLSIFKAAKAVLTYIETTALKAKARKASMCAQSCTHTQTLIHYQAGHHESCRKLALFEFPVHPCDRSPLFLETEDRVHTHTHTQTPTHPQCTHPHFPLCCCCCLLHAHTPPTAVVHSYSLHPPFSFSFLCDSPQKVEVAEDAKGPFSLSSLSPFRPLPHLIFFCMSKTDR